MLETKKTFNHFKLHTQYSICEGAIKIEDLEKFCKSNKIKSVGISDSSNLCGALQFSESVSKSKAQPIIGTQIKFKHKDLIGLIPIIAKNDLGYKIKGICFNSKETILGDYLEKYNQYQFYFACTLTIDKFTSEPLPHLIIKDVIKIN